MSKAVKILILSLCTGMMAVPAQSQFGVSFDYSASLDDNIYLSREKNGDLINDLDLNLHYTFKDTATTLYYNVDYLAYSRNKGRNLLLNKAGIRYAQDFGKQEQHWVYLGSYFMQRDNTDDYYYYDYQQAYAYANFRFRLNRTFFKTGYNFRYRRYKNFMELTNYQHYVFLQMSRSFQTRTTLLMEADWGYKSFNTLSVATPVENGSGNGPGGSISYNITEEQIPSMSHLIVLFRVAQSLHDRVGLYVQYRGQYSLNDESWINNESFYQDEELFDDPFSYTSNGLSSRLTIILPRSLNIRTGWGIMHKDYISELSYTSAEDYPASGDLRQDLRNNLYLRVSKTWYLKPQWIKSINPYLNYSYISNQSNSYWYDYNYHYLTLGMKFRF